MLKCRNSDTDLTTPHNYSLESPWESCPFPRVYVGSQKTTSRPCSRGKTYGQEWIGHRPRPNRPRNLRDNATTPYSERIYDVPRLFVTIHYPISNS